jgi:hypothetical protein
MNTLGIDVETKDAASLINRLKQLKSTELVLNHGMYHADPSYSQVHVVTSKFENELEDWLYRTKGVNYVGVFKINGGEDCAA